MEITTWITLYAGIIGTWILTHYAAYVTDSNLLQGMWVFITIILVSFGAYTISNLNEK